MGRDPTKDGLAYAPVASRARSRKNRMPESIREVVVLAVTQPALVSMAAPNRPLKVIPLPDHISPGAQPHQRRISSEKRKAILNASIETFLASGYQAARMDAIGDLAGVSYATLYKHFPSKDELFLAVVDHLLLRLFAEWRERPVPKEIESGLHAIARNFIGVVTDPQLIATMRMVIGSVQDFPKVGKRLHDERKWFADQTDLWLRARVAEGALTIDNVSRARGELIGMLSEVFYFPRLLDVDYSVSPAKTSRTIESAVSTFLARYGGASKAFSKRKP
jgi:AcrR family transcriptional regulator